MIRINRKRYTPPRVGVNPHFGRVESYEARALHVEGDAEACAKIHTVALFFALKRPYKGVIGPFKGRLAPKKRTGNSLHVHAERPSTQQVQVAVGLRLHAVLAKIGKDTETARRVLLAELDGER